MTALGTVGVLTQYDPTVTRLPIADYTIVRGNYLGTLTVHPVLSKVGPRTSAVGNYIVRQLSIVYRQLWPNHGQRFPQ